MTIRELAAFKMHFPQIIFVCAVILEVCFGAGKRSKRVINGVALKGRPTTYTAIRYYGVLTTVWGIPRRRKLLAFLGSHGDIYCSGSLLTPKIFQTACHCISKVEYDPKKFKNRASVDDQWAGRATIFFGVSKKFGEESMETYYPVLTQKFLIHPKCAKIGPVAFHWDYGLIQIPYDWVKVDDTVPYPWTEIEYAPQYTINTLRSFHYYAQGKQLVCLHVGYGAYLFEATTPKSEFIRTGWASLVGHNKCYDKMSRCCGDLIKPDDFSWACSEPFPHHFQQTGKGDSGGPVSCQNQYFGLVMGSSLPQQRTLTVENITRNIALSTYSPLYLDLFTSAIEYRQDLIHSIDDLRETYSNIIDNWYKTSSTPRRVPGFVFKMHDQEVWKKGATNAEVLKVEGPNVMLTSSGGPYHLTRSLATDIVIGIHVILHGLKLSRLGITSK